MQHPRIAIISGKHPLLVKSGYARYAASLAKQLISLGADVHIYCVGNTSSTEKTQIGSIHVVPIPFLRLFSGHEMATLPYSSILLARQIETADLVWGIGPWTLAGVLASRRPIIANYFTTLRHEYGTSAFSLLERFILTKSDTIVTHYRSTEKILHKEFGFSEFTRLPYTVETRKIIHHNNSENILLTVCRNDPRKGMRYLNEAYTILRNKGVRCKPVIVGPGQPEGPVENITPLLSKAYAFILPSLEEGSGSLAILEAMAAGIPIVATNVDGIPEDVTNGKSGILVSPKNSLQLAHALETLLKKSRLARQMGTNAKKEFQQKHGTSYVLRNMPMLLNKSFAKNIF